MTTKTKRRAAPCDGTIPRPADIPLAYTCACGKHLGPGWTERGARVAMAQRPDELLTTDADGEYILVPRVEAAYWRWLAEAPVGWLELLNDTGEEIRRRNGGDWPSEPDKAALEALQVATLPWMRARFEELAQQYPGLREWSEGDYDAWLARKPAEPD